MSVSIPEVEPGQVPADLPDGLFVLDVREDDEWRAGHIDGATHIPMREVPGRLDEIPAGDQVLVVCRSGARSARVTGFLQAQGRDAVNLAGGLQAWSLAGRGMMSDTEAPPQVI